MESMSSDTPEASPALFSNEHSETVRAPVPTVLLQKQKVFVLDQSSVLMDSMRGLSGIVPVAHVDELTDQVASATTGCVVLDLESIKCSVHALTQRLWAKAIGFPVIAVCHMQTLDVVRELLRAGVSDVLPKPVDAVMLNSAVQRARSLDETGGPSASVLRARLYTLTDREREVMHHCLRGLPTKLIAKQLNVTFQTVDKHRARGLRKMSVSSLLELTHAMSRLSPNALLNFI